MKPSIFKQVEAYQVPAPLLRASPRHWNPGLLRHGGKLWLAYRHHRREAGQRCGVAICPLDDQFRPSEKSQFLRFIGATGTEHHEDCRLFMFRGEPHISYTEMRGYRPGIDYTCVVKYARLALDKKGRWQVKDEFHPQYGRNGGFAKEKNWVFFERNDKLYCIYSTQPQHVILEIDGHKVVGQPIISPEPVWHWGSIRGGTPPVWIGDRWLVVFHSSIPTEVAPHFVRYYAGAYTFEADAPNRILQISESPIMAGSEEDGHQVDPRYVDGWKPYVVFPCGLETEPDGKFLISLGVNDWQCVVARMTLEQMHLGAADGSSFKHRYFKVKNGTVDVKFVDQSRRIQFMPWKIFRPGRCGAAGAGYMRVTDARQAAEAAEHPGAQEITESEYKMAENGLPYNPTMTVG